MKTTDLELATDPKIAHPRDSDALMVVITRAASDSSMDVEKLERLASLYERLKGKQAEQDFNAAMSKAQTEMPMVVKDAKNPQTNSLYARLETMMKVVVPVATKHGFSMSFGTADCPIQGYIRHTCIVSHNAGHSRTYQCDLPNDNLGPKGTANKSLMHGAGSSFSYGRRYLTMMIFNVSTGMEDDDGNGGRKPAIKPDQDDARRLAGVLWLMLKPVRGTEYNWDAANEWMFEHDVLAREDGIMPPNMTADQFQEAINRCELLKQEGTL